MGKRAWVINRFDGGWSTDDQIGIANSFANSEHIEFRKKPSQLTIAPSTREEGSEVIVDLIQNMLMDNFGNLYAIGDQGYFYKRTTAGVWSVKAKLDNGAYGLSYRPDIDKIFITSTTTVSEYSPISNSPTIKVNKYKQSASTIAVSTGGLETYTVPTVVTESAKRSFTSDIEPIYSFKVMIPTKGTGTWTLTLHDEANNVIGTSSLTTGNISVGVLNEFVLTTPARIYVKPNARTYHFHLTSTVADGTVACSTAGDLSTCDYELWASRLISTNNGIHTMQTFQQYETIGNGNYLSVWEPLSEDPGNAEWLRHRLTFQAGLEVCGTALWNEYEAIACERKTSSDTLTPQVGYIFFWDGLSTQWNYYIPVPEGSPRSLHEHKNVLYYEAGGSWYAYAGGEAVKIRQLPYSDTEFTTNADKTNVNPYMMTVYRGVHMLGYPSNSINYNVKYGVYSYGAVDKNYPDSFGYTHSISTGDTNITDGGDGTDLKLGMVKAFGDKLFMSWYNNGQYGLDIIDNASTPYATANWESVVYEGEMPTKSKLAIYLEAGFDTLPSGVELYLKYKISRDDVDWSESTAIVSGNTATFSINKRFYQIQVGFRFQNVTTATPTLTSLTFVFDDNTKEALA